MNVAKLHRPQDLQLYQDANDPDLWHVGYLDNDGAIYTVTFVGPVAQLRAGDYYDALRHGRISDRIEEAVAEEPINMTLPPKSETVRGQITKWMGDIGVRFWLTPRTYVEGPIEAEDWPIIERLEREDKLQLWSPEVARRFEHLRATSRGP
jgi:hypothetical protein